MNDREMKRKEKITQILWFTGGAVCGLAMLSISKASVPNQVTDDTAIYQKLSEIQVAKEGTPNFDSDISRLSQLESRYHDRLPGISRQVRRPMHRVAQKPYSYRGQVQD